MKFIIDNTILGTKKSLYCGVHYKWIEEIPEGIWYIDNTIKDDNWCLDTLLALNHKKIDLKPEEKYVNVINTVMPLSKTAPPLQDMMPKKHHQKHIKDIVYKIKSNINNLDIEYYKSTWIPATSIFHRLKPVKINNEKWESWLKSEVGNKPIIKTFKPKNGYANSVCYDRLNTRTGRLTVKSGPNILTLRKDARNILKSRFNNGSIVQYDFCALEARIVLYEFGKSCDNIDLYGYLSQELFSGKMPRDIIKQAVISEMYGQGRQALGSTLGLNGSALNKFVNRINEYFGIQQLTKKIKIDYINLGFVKNKYKRQIQIEEPLNHILFNSYIQSTGVDITLLGFDLLCQKLSNDVIPIFLLHDALLLDVPDINKLDKIIWLEIPGFEQKWPLKLEHISGRNLH